MNAGLLGSRLPPPGECARIVSCACVLAFTSPSLYFLLQGMKWSFDANRLMQFTRAVKVDGEMQLCFHEKEGAKHTVPRLRGGGVETME